MVTCWGWRQQDSPSLLVPYIETSFKLYIQKAPLSLVVSSSTVTTSPNIKHVGGGEFWEHASQEGRSLYRYVPVESSVPVHRLRLANVGNPNALEMRAKLSGEERAAEQSLMMRKFSWRGECRVQSQQQHLLG